MIFFEVGSDPAAPIIGNPDYRIARTHPRKEESRSQQNRRKFHIPALVQIRPSARIVATARPASIR